MSAPKKPTMSEFDRLLLETFRGTEHIRHNPWPSWLGRNTLYLRRGSKQKKSREIR